MHKQTSLCPRVLVFILVLHKSTWVRYCESSVDNGNPRLDRDSIIKWTTTFWNSWRTITNEKRGVSTLFLSTQRPRFDHRRSSEAAKPFWVQAGVTVKHDRCAINNLEKIITEYKVTNFSSRLQHYSPRGASYKSCHKNKHIKSVTIGWIHFLLNCHFSMFTFKLITCVFAFIMTKL